MGVRFYMAHDLIAWQINARKAINLVGPMDSATDCMIHNKQHTSLRGSRSMCNLYKRGCEIPIPITTVLSILGESAEYPLGWKEDTGFFSNTIP